MFAIIQYLIPDDKYSRLWGSREPREIFSHANKSWFTVYIENKSVELIGENNDVLVNFTSWI
jgi:hypothetical protein